MTGSVQLTAAMRANLLSLQGTQSLLDQTQLRLSTGKKVNSALDNPVNFFAAQSLTNRASDLSSLLDSMGQGIQTISTTNQAITSLTNYVTQLKSIANSAKGALTGASSTQKVQGSASIAAADYAGSLTGAATLTGTVVVGTATNTLDAGSPDLNISAGTFTVTHGTHTYTSGTLAATDTIQDVMDGINGDTALGVTASLDGTNHLVLTAADGKDVTVGGTNADALFGATPTADTADSPLAVGGTFDITIGTGSALTVTVTQGMTATQLASAISTATSGKVTASWVDDTATPGNKKLTLSASADTSFTVATSATATALGIAGTSAAVADLSQVQTYQTSYSDVIGQITQTAKDASYQGSNLIDGTSGDLIVQVNEKSASPITIGNQDLTATTGLGLDATVTWTSTADIDATIAKVTAALSTLRSASSSFANNLSLLQTRQDFTKNLVNTLTDGASQLTIADTNEEGANLLSLQTSQQLGIQALALSSQANQSVLRLFG